jgi:hypothetical protein
VTVNAAAGLAQQKLIAPGQVRKWMLDLDAMASVAEWSRENPGLLADEMSELVAAFPTLIAAVGAPLGEPRCWVEAAEPYPHDDNELLVFDRGIRHAVSGELFRLPEEGTINGIIVRIPAPISGRPFCDSLDRRLETLNRTNPRRANLWRQAMLSVGNKRYLAPRFGMWFAQSWPHADPPVMVWSEYFEMLDIPADHVYFADQYYRLCLYASWREQPAVQVLQNRVVPRLLIDLMVADLQALGRLDQALEQLDMTLYEMYNLVGRPDQVEPLQRVYRDLVGRELSISR